MKRAFTLVELIVCIAIIVILAAILFPVFNRTRCGPNARSSCQLNLKQIAFAWKQYTDDFERAPTRATNGDFYGWSDALSAYGAKPALFHCPSRSALPGTDPTAPDYCDYWMNQRVAGRALKEVALPARTLVFGEGEGAIRNTFCRICPSNGATTTDRLLTGTTKAPITPLLMATSNGSSPHKSS